MCSKTTGTARDDVEDAPDCLAEARWSSRDAPLLLSRKEIAVESVSRPSYIGF